MELTLAAATFVLLAGVGYAGLYAARRSRFVNWSLLCTSLFALATRDLFRPRGRVHAGATRTDVAPERTDDATARRAGDRATGDGSDDERPRPPLFARILKRFASWLG